VTNAINGMTNVLCQYAQDPAANLKNYLCPGGTDSGGCAANDFLPHFSMPISACAQANNMNRSYAPPITAAGISAAMGKFTENTMERCARVWDDITAKNPGINDAMMRTIAIQASQLAAADAANQSTGTSTSSLTPDGKVQLAMTDMSYVNQTYGATSQSSTGILKEYEKSLTGCTPASMANPLLMCGYIAKAANVVLPQSDYLGNKAVSVDTNITYTSDLKTDARNFFNFTPSPEAETGLAKAGMDNQTAAKMLEETFACAANGQLNNNQDLHITSPALQLEIATHGRNKWAPVSYALSRSVMCEGVNTLLNFMKGKVDEAKTRVSQPNAPLTTAKTTSTDPNTGATTTAGGDAVTGDTGRKLATDYLDAASHFLDRQIQVNTSHCPNPDVVGQRLKELLNSNDD
jgi:hypothetical protein